MVIDAGIQKNWTGWGSTTFYGEFGRFWDGTAGLLAATAYPSLGPLADGTFAAGAIVVGSEVTWWGVGVVQTIDAAAVDLYVAYRQYQADATSAAGQCTRSQETWRISGSSRRGPAFCSESQPGRDLR